MRYGRIDARAHKLDLIEADLIDTAKRLCGLEPLKTDDGVVWKEPGIGGVAIIVAEFGLFMPPLNQHYFAFDDRLYAGNALLYGFDDVGETIDFDAPVLGTHQERATLRWFESGYDVSKAITRGELIKPQLVLNGSVVWEWPQPRPDMERLARKMAGL